MTAQQDQSFNFKAFGWSAGSHALLLLLFFFWRYSIATTTVSIPSGGFEVNLGTDENGWGDDQPEKTGHPSEFRSAVQYKSQTTPDKTPDKLLRSNEADAPEINANKIQKQEATVHHDETPTTATPAPPKPKYTYEGETGNGGNNAANTKAGKSEGNTTGSGDRGVPGGTPGAANYTGTPGNGNGGINHTLTGRKIFPERFDADFHEGGKVVIRVTVDRNGNIVNKRVLSSPSQELSGIALDKLNQAHFSRTEGGEPQQFGEVTILFKSH